MLTAVLLGTTGIAGALAGARPVQAQAEDRVVFDIPAQPLSSALAAFSRSTGLNIIYGATVPDVRAPGVSGPFEATQALNRLLTGTGLTYRLVGDGVVRLEAAPGAAPSGGGAIQLGAVRVEGAARSSGGLSSTEGFTADSIYEQPGAVDHIGAETIERYRGSSPADIFRGAAGVMSGEARNGAGAVDLNIRGLQGFGRVATTIDGAENAVTVYQGYQGVSNRTFIDPDFIAGVDITRGSDASSYGTAGSVAIRTVGADDIIREGETWGLRVRGGFTTNSSDPTPGDISGYLYRSGVGVAEPSETGMDRPGDFEPTGGWGSVIGAFRSDAVDVLAGYTYRERGNYHAGAHGPVAEPLNIGDTENAWGGIQSNTMINAGIANFRAGEEVLNTELKTESWLTKLTARFGDGHTLQLGYNGFRSEAGDRIASRLVSNTGRSLQQAQTAGTLLDTYTARYRWSPSTTDLVDLKLDTYWSHLELRNPVRGGRNVRPEDIGLVEGFRPGSDTDMWGLEISNMSRFFPAHGDLELDYGLSYRGEDTRGSRHADVLEGWNTPRDGFRHEVAGFVKGAYRPRDWVTVSAGLRYAHFWSEDRFDPYEPGQITSYRGQNGFTNDGGGFSPSVGVAWAPFAGAQLYASYSSTLRAPSLTEAVSAYNSFVAQQTVRPERSRNWELGANIVRENVLLGGDRGSLKLAYFNWNVDDYIARNVRTESTLSLNMENIDRATFEGIELSGRYVNGGFSVDLAANYFLDVEYCRTADTCSSKSLYGDYATNHVPPEYTLDLSLSQALFNERLILGGRVHRTGPRAIGHGDVTAQGASEFVALVDWEPYTLTDVFADYRLTNSLVASVRVENLFDRFYVDPLGLVMQPGPGRTVSASLTHSFGGGDGLFRLPDMRLGEGEVNRNWTGFYLGAHGGGGYMLTSGVTTTLDGTPDPEAALESADEEAPGGLVGLQAGYNHQFPGGLVIGVEADVSRTNLRETDKVMSINPALAEAGYREAFMSFDVDRTASISGRIGYALSDRWLVYGSAGVAFARENQWRDQYISDVATVTNPFGRSTKVFFTERASQTRRGLSLGLGAEFALSDHWSMRTAYDYSRFRFDDFHFPNARAGTTLDYRERIATQVGTEWVDLSTDPGFAALCAVMPEICVPIERPIYEYSYVDHTGSSNVIEGRRASNDLEMHAIRIGLSFRF